MHFKVSFAISFKLDQSKILLSGNGLSLHRLLLVKMHQHVFRGLPNSHCCHFWSKPCAKQQVLDSSELKEFVDDNFEIDENGAGGVGMFLQKSR